MIRKLASGKYRLYSRKKKSEDRSAAQSRHLRQPRRRAKARACRAIFQAGLISFLSPLRGERSVRAAIRVRGRGRKPRQNTDCVCRRFASDIFFRSFRSFPFVIASSTKWSEAIHAEVTLAQRFHRRSGRVASTW